LNRTFSPSGQETKERDVATMVVNYNIRRQEPGLTIMDFSGQLTLGNALQGVEHAIKDVIEQGSRKLVLDLAQLHFLDSAGVGMLAVCAGAMEKVGGRIIVVGAHGRVEEVLLLTHLHRIIGLYPDLTAACAALANSPTPPATA
jgi:anti-sigma B factor antagonist